MSSKKSVPGIRKCKSYTQSDYKTLYESLSGLSRAKYVYRRDWQEIDDMIHEAVTKWMLTVDPSYDEAKQVMWLYTCLSHAYWRYEYCKKRNQINKYSYSINAPMGDDGDDFTAVLEDDNAFNERDSSEAWEETKHLLLSIEEHSNCKTVKEVKDIVRNDDFEGLYAYFGLGEHKHTSKSDQAKYSARRKRFKAHIAHLF